MLQDELEQQSKPDSQEAFHQLFLPRVILCYISPIKCLLAQKHNYPVPGYPTPCSSVDLYLRYFIQLMGFPHQLSSFMITASSIMIQCRFSVIAVAIIRDPLLDASVLFGHLYKKSLN